MSNFILTTPSSRGIGFAITRLLLTSTTLPIIATARKDVERAKQSLLEGLKDVDPERLHVRTVDVTDEDTISSLAEELPSLLQSTKESPPLLRLAFAIPGILHPEKSPQQIQYADALETFKVNTLGPMMLMKHFASYMPRKKNTLEALQGLPDHAVWASMSARVGSISDNNLGGWYSYRSSKAGLNSLIKSFDINLQGRCGDKAMAVGLHPGTVKTGLSKEFWSGVKEGHLFEPEWAAERLLEVVRGKGVKDRGKCWDWEGKEVPP